MVEMAPLASVLIIEQPLAVIGNKGGMAMDRT